MAGKIDKFLGQYRENDSTITETNKLVFEANNNYSENMLIDGSLEVWEPSGQYIPTYWTFKDVTNFDDDYTGIIRTDGVTGFGLQAATHYNLGALNYVTNLMVGNATITSNDDVQMIAKVKQTTGTGGKFLIIGNYSAGEADYLWNFTIEEWEVQTGAPTADQFYLIDCTSSYETITTPIITAPNIEDGFRLLAGFSGDNSGFYEIDDVQILVNGVDGAIDGGFEEWTSLPSAKLTNYTQGYWGVSTGTNLINISTDKQLGEYSAELTTLTATKPYFVQSVNSLTEGDNYRFNLYSKADGTASANIRLRVSAFNSDPLNATQEYNFTSNEWVAYTHSGDAPTSDFYSEAELTTTFALKTFEEVPVPANGNLSFVIWLDGDNNDIAYVDNLQQQRNPGDVACFRSECTETLANLDDNDVALILEFQDDNLIKILKSGIVSSGLSKLDFSGVSLDVATPTTDNNPANKDYVDGEISSLETSLQSYAEGQANNVPRIINFHNGEITVPLTLKDYYYLLVPAELNGLTLQSADFGNVTAGSGENTTTIDLYNVTQSVSMLEAYAEFATGSNRASGTPSETNATIATSDIIKIEVKTIANIPQIGLFATLIFK